jgi:heme/copper-type cytochrome/quinol oxidase subunit 2
MKYFTALRLLEWMVTLSLIAISVMKFNIVTLIIILTFAISLWFSVVIYRRGKNAQDERDERIHLRSCAFSYATVIILIIVFFLLARFVTRWPNTQLTLLLLWSCGSLSRNVAEYYYRYGK